MKKTTARLFPTFFLEKKTTHLPTGCQIRVTFSEYNRMEHIIVKRFKSVKNLQYTSSNSGVQNDNPNINTETAHGYDLVL